MLTRRDVVLGSTLAATAALADTANARQRKPTMAQAATEFLAALDAEQKQKAQLPFNSEERFSWHYVPLERQGLRYKNMKPEQQKLAQALLLIGLSKSGFRKIEAIRQLEYVLKDIEKGSGPTRDPDLYYFTIFGDPDPKGTWGFRYEGHHVSLHWTCLKGKIIASSPQFLGSNPGEVRSGPQKGTRVLAAEEDLGRAVVKSLDETQRKEAIISAKAPGDILTAASRKAQLLDDKGIPYKQLNKEQQGLLLTLLEEYANVQVQEIAKQRLEAVRKAGMETIKFAWMGGIERGEPHYYRIQGATFLVEYDNTQNDANHIHSVWRDFKGDFGVDLLALHYHTADHDHGHDV
ncbi:MAG: hypothetical protein JWL77_2820 [Chthonomonadaceae bacterium]|nr:hypothetical protein [Chthonomonadaceae bacterium]